MVRKATAGRAMPGRNTPFGNAVRAMREARAVSQERMAAICQMDRSTYASIEQGRRNPSLRTVVRIASGLKVRPSELVAAMEAVGTSGIRFPVPIVSYLREGLTSEMESLAEALEPPSDWLLSREKVQAARERLDACIALLDVIGWRQSDATCEVDLDLHLTAVMRGLAAELASLDDVALTEHDAKARSKAAQSANEIRAFLDAHNLFEKTEEDFAGDAIQPTNDLGTNSSDEKLRHDQGGGCHRDDLGGGHSDASDPVSHRVFLCCGGRARLHQVRATCNNWSHPPKFDADTTPPASHVTAILRSWS